MSQLRKIQDYVVYGDDFDESELDINSRALLGIARDIEALLSRQNAGGDA